MPFKFIKTAIPEVILIEPTVFGDARGFFMESYKDSDFAEAGITDTFVQDNHSRSTKNVLRGLHYQKAPKAQAKLVRCIRGEIFDVAVDLRKGSASYGKWVGFTLSAANNHILYIPCGFAHGFATRSEEADILYKSSNTYAPELDRGVLWKDPEINISWDITTPLLSSKDAQLPLLKDADNTFTIL